MVGMSHTDAQRALDEHASSQRPLLPKFYYPLTDSGEGKGAGTLRAVQGVYHVFLRHLPVIRRGIGPQAQILCRLGVGGGFHWQGNASDASPRFKPFAAARPRGRRRRNRR